MSHKGYKQTEEHKRKHLDQIKGVGNGRWKGPNKRPKKPSNRPTPEQKRRCHLRTMYGITPEDYDLMYEQQKGNCAVCGTFKARLFVDHSHEDGKVRGLLCTNCNTGIGMFHDNTDHLKKAIEYLQGIS